MEEKKSEINEKEKKKMETKRDGSFTYKEQ
jgi:hypothetical protein